MNITPKTKRPGRNDPAVLKAAAEKLAPKVQHWLGNDDSTPLAEIVKDLEKALLHRDDGYEIARKLDGSYQPDAALVELLDNHGKSDALSRAAVAWVAAEGLQPIPPGTQVRAPRERDCKDHIGIVTANWPDGKATVCFAALGHAEERTDADKSGSRMIGYLLPWENLEVLP